MQGSEDNLVGSLHVYMRIRDRSGFQCQVSLPVEPSSWPGALYRVVLLT